MVLKNARYIGAFFKICGKPLQRIDEPQSIQNTRSQSDSHAAHILDGFIDQGAHCQCPDQQPWNLCLAIDFVSTRSPFATQSVIDPIHHVTLVRWLSLFFLTVHDPSGKTSELLLGFFDGGDVRREFHILR